MPTRTYCKQCTGPPPPAEMWGHLPPPPPPPPGVTFVNANVTSLRAHYETLFDFSSDLWACKKPA